MARARKTMNLIPGCDSLETRRVLSGNSLSHAFDRLSHGLDHLGQQISHLGQHSTNHSAAHDAMTAAAGVKVHYHHIVK